MNSSVISNPATVDRRYGHLRHLGVGTAITGNRNRSKMHEIIKRQDMGMVQPDLVIDIK